MTTSLPDILQQDTAVTTGIDRYQTVVLMVILGQHTNYIPKHLIIPDSLRFQEIFILEFTQAVTIFGGAICERIGEDGKTLS